VWHDLHFVRIGSTIFWHPATLTLNRPISTFPANGDVRFDYEYSDESGGQLQFISEKMEYTVSASQYGGGFFVDRVHVD
jgi:hypothetical protein